ncbi:Ankyrin-1 [Dactylella cylindrospora]|nr:Ankyrin-1 [Dactylella cylindrospora]
MDLEFTDADEFEKLRIASLQDDAEEASRLLGSYNFTPDDLEEPLRYATMYCHPEIAKLLLSHGAEPLVEIGHMRILAGYEATLQEFLNHGWDLNVVDTAESVTAINYEQSLSDPKRAKWLLERGADPNIESDRYLNTMAAALKVPHNGVVELLLRNGANISRGDTYLAMTPWEKEEFRNLRVLLEAGANPNDPSAHWGSPLHYCIIRQFGEAARMFLDYGADPSIKGGNGRTPAEEAAQQEWTDKEAYGRIIKLLAAKAETPDSRGTGPSNK